MYLPLLAALLSTTSIYSPEVEKRGISTIKATRTVADVVSVTSIVAGLFSTITKIYVLTTTTTTARYTSTFTSTIFGEPINFVSVVDSSHASANTPSSTSLAPIKSSSSGTSAEAAPTTFPAAETTPKTSTAETTPKTSTAETTPKTSTAESKPLSSENTTLLPSSTSLKPIFVSSTSLTPSPTSAPATTAAPSSSSTKAPSSQKPDSESDSDWGTVFPSTTDGYLLEAVLTSISGSVCIVDYHYYLTDSTMTVTSVSTIYSTTTLV
ncbi:hypothetical protein METBISCDRAFT_23506 [Metschnikowia bicuspidata]|uniref:Uncharacterized protein n=1 Tax=Metschnikowia bicuspidata TaxID=27322 RepID=A0A4P9ZC09_9ASCO|nr:hypothetical protein METBISCDRAFT_23506 [Metschnikowia bicuspidata]